MLSRRFILQMDYQPPQLRRHLRYNLNQHRSTTDLLPKSRPEALRARHAAARSKLNLIARQLYELKYDHEWQQEQLRVLVDRGTSLQREAHAGILRVREAEEIAAGMAVEDLRIGLGGVGKEGGLGSERSTEPEREEAQPEGRAEGRDKSGCQTDIQHSYAEHISVPEEMRASQKSNQVFSPSKLRRSSSLKPASSKKVPPKQLISSLPIGNIVIFTLLLFIVLALL